MSDRVLILDTTLRDGEQAPGITLDPDQKVAIAKQLCALGVDAIEAGFPIASDGDFEGVRAVARAVRGPIVGGLARTHIADVDRCGEALKDAPRRRIHVFIATSDIHMKYKLRLTPDEVVASAAAGVARARTYTDDVQFSPEDGTRSDLDFMCRVLQAAVDAGASTLNITDTVGYATPKDYAERLRYIRTHVRGDYVISTHCHNDLGLAVANTLAGLEAGARQLECTINGIGERAGNAALEEVVVALRSRPEQFPDVTFDVRTEELNATSKMVAEMVGYPVQYNKAVVGRNAFAHESGIHQHGVLAHRETYEFIDAASVGQEGSQLVFGKHSGRHALRERLSKLGVEVDQPTLNTVFEYIKTLADKKIPVTDADLRRIVAVEGRTPTAVG